MNRPPAIVRMREYLRTRRRPVVVCGVAVVAMMSAVAGTWVLLDARHASPSERTEQLQPIGLQHADPGVRPTRVVTFAEGCMTGGCHANLTSTALVHPATSQGACGSCHSPDAGNHAFPVAREGLDLCAACHDTGSNERYQHGAMSDGACLSCHNPHGGGSRALLVAATPQAVCGQCHPAIEGTNQHAPYAEGACGECHSPHGAENQHLLIGGAGSEVCSRCHGGVVGAMASSTHSHAGVTGGCMACHTPHASHVKGLLRAPAKVLCVSCHPDVGSAIAGATVSHDPVLAGEQCVTCHDPHASEHPKMLVASQGTVCLKCHDAEVKGPSGRTVAAMGTALATQPVIHGAVAHGDCAACHSVHGATHVRLLKQLNPDAFTDPYDAGNYAMCFGCHDRAIADESSPTQFRDGDHNLHATHLKAGERSRGCSACHSVHSSTLPRLIASSVRFEGGSWAMPMKFVLTPSGGSCAPGCHEQMAYSRLPGGVRQNGGQP